MLLGFFQRKTFSKKLAGSLSFGKLRGSFGTTGNDQIGDYKFTNLYDPVYVSSSYQNSLGLSPLGLPNPYFVWEETVKFQVGLELGFVKDRILINGSYSRNQSSNQLLSYTLPAITGYNSIYENFPATIQEYKP